MFRICCTRFLIYYEVFIAARLELSTLAITTHVSPTKMQARGHDGRALSPRDLLEDGRLICADSSRTASATWVAPHGCLASVARTIRSTKRVELEENVPIQSCQHASKCACIGCIRL